MQLVVGIYYFKLQNRYKKSDIYYKAVLQLLQLHSHKQW